MSNSTQPKTQRRRLRPVLWLSAVVLVLALAGVYLVVSHTGGATVSPKMAGFLRSHGITYSLDVRKEPRPERVHRLLIDLTNPKIRIVAALGTDPGGGPGRAVLESPLVLAERSKAVAFVNANPWWGVLDAEGKRETHWSDGLPVEILGMAASEGEVRHADHPAYYAFWFDRMAIPHFGHPTDEKDVVNGFAGLMILLHNGRDVHERGTDPQPRTALGLSASGRRLYLVVVDGRQPGHSEGMTYEELAAYMLALGCNDALSLDGGGSSIMILADEKGERHIVSSPSDRELGVPFIRPIAVGLAVQVKE